jgi:hypothetical protein
MASSSRPAAPPVGEDITALKTELYEACVPFAKDNPKIVFHQVDIFDLDIVPNNDVNILLQVSQLLLDEKLFKVVHDTDGMGWKLRTVDEAKKYVLSLFYILRVGIWADCKFYTAGIASSQPSRKQSTPSSTKPATTASGPRP